jgi:hypothetical protein
MAKHSFRAVDDGSGFSTILSHPTTPWIAIARGFLMQIKELSASNLFYCLDVKLTEEFMHKLVLGVAALALSAVTASAQGYGYGYGYGYAGAPLYDYAATGYGYAAPAYAAPAPAATTVIIVTPTPAYTAPPVAYAPGYWGGYGGGYGWGGYGRAGWWR